MVVANVDNTSCAPNEAPYGGFALRASPLLHTACKKGEGRRGKGEGKRKGGGSVRPNKHDHPRHPAGSTSRTQEGVLVLFIQCTGRGGGPLTFQSRSFPGRARGAARLVSRVRPSPLLAGARLCGGGCLLGRPDRLAARRSFFQLLEAELQSRDSGF